MNEKELKDLNEKFAELLKKHENDKQIIELESVTECYDTFGDDANEEDYAAIFNAYDELCYMHPDKVENICWVYGACEYGYDNPWDVCIIPA